MCTRIGRSASVAAGALLVIATLLSTAGTAVAGPPFRTDDPEPVDLHHMEINLFSQGTKTQDGWIGILPGFEANYGALPNLQLHMIVPQGYAAPTDDRTGFGLGDVELGAKFRFINPSEKDWFPQVAVFPLVEVPVGNQHLGFSTGHMQVFLPIWLQKDFGPWTVYGGGGYWINPGAGNRDFGFVGTAVWRKITEQLDLGVEVYHQGSPVTGGRDTTGFNVGATYDFSENWHLLASAGSGMQNRSQTNQFAYYLAVQLTF